MIQHRKSHKSAILALATASTFLVAAHANAAIDTWTGGTDNLWSTTTNWSTPPANGDSLVFNDTGANTANTDDIANLTITGMTFSGSTNSYTIGGTNELLLGTPQVAGTTGVGSITSNSTVAQTLTLPIRLGIGDHTIAGGTGGINLNGALNHNVGGVVAFSGTVNSSSVTNFGSTGILGGYATVGTNYATNNGTGIVALSTYTDITTTGSIASDPNSNVRINSGAAGTISLTANTDVNTLMQNVNNIAETVDLGGNRLRFGQLGGIFRTQTSNTTNATVIQNGTVTAGGADNTAGEIVLNGGAGTGTATYISISAQITDNGTGAVTLVKTGRGYAAVSNANNSFSGGTIIAEGRLGAAGGQLGNGSLTILSGGELLGSGTWTNPISIAGTGPQNEAGNGAIRGGTFSSSTTITLTGDAGICSATVNSQITGGFSLQIGATANVGSGGSNTTLGNPAGSNNWTGDTRLVGRTGTSAGQATLKLAASNQIPDGPGFGNLIFGITGINAGSNLTLDLNGNSETVNGLSSVSGTTNPQLITNTGAADSTLTLGNNNATATFNGTINNGTTNKISLTKIGSGIQTLTASGNYTGVTTISGGALAITSATANTNLPNSAKILVGDSLANNAAVLDVTGITTAGGYQVASGQTLAGFGTVKGSATLATGSTLAPGNSAGVLSETANAVLSTGVSLNYDLDTPNVAAGTGGNDLFAVAGALTMNSNLTLNVTPGVDFAPGTYHLATFATDTDNSAGFSGWTVTGLNPALYTSSFSLAASSLDLVVSNAAAVPEPASLGVLALGAVAMLKRRRK